MKHAAVIVLLLPLAAFAQNSKVNWWAFDMGYAASGAGNTTVKSAVGVGFVGIGRSGNSMATGGFLADTLFAGTVVPVEENQDLPLRYSLSQNYPNPFNPTTQIEYALPAGSDVRLSIFDILGREVAVAVNEHQAPGRYMVRLDASELASGVYFYRLSTGSFSEVKRMLLLR